MSLIRGDRGPGYQVAVAAELVTPQVFFLFLLTQELMSEAGALGGTLWLWPPATTGGGPLGPSAQERDSAGPPRCSSSGPDMLVAQGLFCP